MSRDVVYIRGNGRSSRISRTDSTYTGYATETGPVVDRLNNEVLTNTPSPGNLSLSSGTLFNNVYIAATWDPAGDSNVVGYEVVFRRDDTVSPAVVQRVETTSAWFEPALGGADYTVIVSNVYVNGVLGQNTTTDTITAATDSTIPDIPTGLSIGTGIRSITVSWNENTEDDMQFGLGQYRLQISDDSGFSNIIQDKKVGALVTTFSDLETNVQYYVRIASVDTSGNESAFSGFVTATTGEVQGTDIANLAITNAKIANSTIGFAKIIELQANQLIAGSGFINALTVASGGSISSANYNAGTAGWRITNNNAEFNNVTIRGTLDGATGSFSGSLSAATGSFLGSITGASGNFSGSITGATGDFDGTVDANNINAGTIEGSTIKTGATGSNRIEMTTGNTLTWYNSSNNILCQFGDNGTYFEMDGTVGLARPLWIHGDFLLIEADFGNITMNAGAAIAITSGNGSNEDIVLNVPGTNTSTGVDLRKNNTVCVRAIQSGAYGQPVSVLRRMGNTSSTGMADLGFGIVGTYSSRAELKEWTRTVEHEAARDRIMAYRPVDWAYKPDLYPDNPFHGLATQRGFVVEEVAAVDSNSVDYNWIDKDDRSQLAAMPNPEDLREGQTMEEWFDENYPIESAEPSMWNHFAILADVVAHNQFLEKRVEELESRN